MVRQWQDMFFEKRYSSVDMVNPDFQMIAKGYGIASEKVTEREKLEDSIHKFLSHEGSYLLEVMVGKENNIFPMIPTGASVSEIRLELSRWVALRSVPKVRPENGFSVDSLQKAHPV